MQSADLDALAKAMRPGKTALVWLETPSNPLWDVTDIQAASDIAHKAGARLASTALRQPRHHQAAGIRRRLS